MFGAISFEKGSHRTSTRNFALVSYTLSHQHVFDHYVNPDIQYDHLMEYLGDSVAQIDGTVFSSASSGTAATIAAAALRVLS